MKVDVLMPKMGESITEGTILSWAKSKGDKVDKDESILEISTDKVDTEVPSPDAGILVEILAEEGDTVEVGEKIAVIETEGDGGGEEDGGEEEDAGEEEKEDKKQKDEKKGKKEKEEEDKKKSGKDKKEEKAGKSEEEEDEEEDEEKKDRKKKSRSKAEGKSFYSPVVMRIASEEDIDMDELEEIEGSGASGRVTKKDLMEYLESRGEEDKGKKKKRGEEEEERESKKDRKKEGEEDTERRRKVETPKRGPEDDIEVEAMDNIKKLMAEHMVRSVETSPHVTLVTEVDMTKIVKYREANTKAFKKREGISLTYMPFIADASVRALKDFPYMNSSIDGTDILIKKNVGLGIAVAMESGGLIVPVVKGADTMNLTGLAHSINDVAKRARNKRLQPDEIQGGTFTITNFGVFGSTFGTPIINQPQVGILGVGAIKKRPVVVEADGEDTIAIRSIMVLSITFDHRLIDGAYGGQYLEQVKKYLENFNEDAL